MDKIPLTYRELLDAVYTLDADPVNNILWLLEYRQKIAGGVYTTKVDNAGEEHLILEAYPHLELAATKELQRIAEKLHSLADKEGSEGSVQVTIDLGRLEDA
jgi:hypothetical protein